MWHRSADTFFDSCQTGHNIDVQYQVKHGLGYALHSQWVSVTFHFHLYDGVRRKDEFVSIKIS